MFRYLAMLGLATLLSLAAAGGTAVADAAEDAAALLQAGKDSFEAGRCEEALQHWTDAAGAYGQLGDAPSEARCLRNAGRACWKLGRRDKEIDLTLRALEAYQRAGMDAETAGCHYDVGLAYYETDVYPEAATHFRSAMELYAKLGMQREEADSAGNLGVACDLLDRYQEALEYQHRALDIYRRLNLERQVADCWVNLGTAHYNLDQYERTIEYESMALGVYRRLGVEAEAGSCLMMLGAAYDDLGLYERGVEYSKDALGVFERLGEARRAAQCTANIGVAYYLQGKNADAVDHLTRALEAYRRLGMPHQEANCTENLASAHAGLGELQQAVELHVRALAMYEHLGVTSQQARCLSNLATEYLDLGRYAEALDSLDRSSRLYRVFARAAVTSGRRWVPEPMYSVEGIYGDVYFARDEQGDLYRAYRHYARAIGIVESLRDRGASSTELKASYFGRMSWVYDRMVGLLLEMKRRGLAVEQAALNEEEPGYWDELGLPQIALWSGWPDYDQALLYYSDRSRARVLQELLAGREVALADPRAADVYRDWTQLSAQERGLQRRLAGADVAAVAETREQLEAVTRRRREAQSELARTSWGQVVTPGPARVSEVRELLAPDEAIVQYKVLWDRVAVVVVLPGAVGGGVLSASAPTAAGEQRPLWGREQVLRGDAVLRRLNELRGNGRPARPGLDGETVLQPDELRAHFSVAELVWLFREPLAAYGPGSEAADVTRQAQQAYVGAALYDLLLRPVETVLGEHGVTKLLIVPDGALCYLPFSALVCQAPGDLDLTEAGQVYANPRMQYALEKWRLSYLPSVGMYMGMHKTAPSVAARPLRLCVFADPVFSPAQGSGPDFSGALTQPEPTGGARGALDVLAQVARQRAAGEDTKLARLPHTRDEAIAALAGFGGKEDALCPDPLAVNWGQSVALVGAAAQEPLAYGDQLRQYTHVLFSTHGVIDPAHPEFSYVALSSPAALGIDRPSSATDGNLMMPEAFGLSLDAQMVTLSACRTAEGDYQRGEGILGLTAAMFVSGARAVTATLWSVDDAITARLIGDYHRRLGGGEPAAEALTASQLAMLSQARRAFALDPTNGPAAYANPYYWAPFVLMGQWQ